MATIYDIAKHCNISAATVSYVLNGRGDERKISAKTQERVLRASKELGYDRIRPSQAQSSSPLIAVYWLQKQLEYTMPPLITGINNAIASEISPIDVAIRPYTQGHLYSQSHLWNEPTCDAAIIIGANTDDLNHLAQQPTKVPAVLFNRELAGYSSVTIDHEKAGRLAAEHAISRGGDSILLVMNPSLLGLQSRGRSILETCSTHGIDMKNSVMYCTNNIDDGYELGWEMIRKNQLKKVIICIYDMVALGIMRALNEAGIVVGEEIQVVATSSGPSRLFARSSPPMTVVDLKTELISERALKMAIELGYWRITTPQQIVIPPSIIYRHSCPMNDITI